MANSMGLSQGIELTIYYGNVLCTAKHDFSHFRLQRPYSESWFYHFLMQKIQEVDLDKIVKN
ncbi:protein of unknown function [Shewanella benthica]|uniref:Uncharacterized protein n=1 Tax=Shewanella benthica TaxID=43661 RepID=A0A330M1M6_9GAMM|nr:protein of unknown function [Shewanella benthica]